VATGELVWTFVTARGTENAGGYLVGSMAYNEGKLFVVDMFFITALDAKTGEVIWKSWQGTELYTSPTVADGKVYVATDRRLIYVLNESTGKRLSFFEPSSNCWSSPVVYEGRMYIGNNDWNVYCFSEYPVTQGQISVTLDNNQVKQNEPVTGSGQISPVIAYAPITVSFVKSDGTVDKQHISARDDGTFSFEHIPDKVGELTVAVRCSGATYIMQSVEMSLNVFDSQQTSVPEQTPPENEPVNGESSDIPLEYIIVAVVALIVAVIAVVAYMFVKKRNKSSHVVISN